MEKKNEPNFKKSSCSYCGDAGASHALFYFDSLMSGWLDPQTSWVARRAPEFLKRFADWLPVAVLKVFAFFGMVKFSVDPERARTFRSKVIWEEAERRGIRMEQLIFFGKPMEYYRAFLRGREIFFNSLPIPPKFLEFSEDWDNKFVLKKRFEKEGIPVPRYELLSFLNTSKLASIFEKLPKPLIVKPKLGSRGRHTVTNIHTLEDLRKGVRIAGQLSPHLIVEEHLKGYVCRATVVGGKLSGFYRGAAPSVTGDGVHTVHELILEKDRVRPDRVEKVVLGEELKEHIRRSGYTLDDILPKDETISLTHRVGRLFGGATKEMLGELHPSFIPVLENAARVTGLAVAGFDCIIADPESPAASQRWGIIECNTLPYIDLHYYALEGKPENIAGRIWDLWG